MVIYIHNIYLCLFYLNSIEVSRKQKYKMTDIVGSNASAVTAQSQSLFSASIDLEWHNSPEGRGVLAHLMDQSTGLRRNYG